MTSIPKKQVVTTDKAIAKLLGDVTADVLAKREAYERRSVREYRKWRASEGLDGSPKRLPQVTKQPKSCPGQGILFAKDGGGIGD